VSRSRPSVGTRVLCAESGRRGGFGGWGRFGGLLLDFETGRSTTGPLLAVPPVLDGTGASTELVLELGVDTALLEVEAKPGVDE
jgi:hypothetical protein